MTSPSYYQPLINPPSSAKKTIHKFLLFSLSIATFFSLVYLCLLIIHPQTNPSIPSYHLHSNHQPSNGHDHLLGKILSVHVSHINTALEALIKETKNYNSTNMKNVVVQRGALLDCIELMDLSRDRVALSMKSTKPEDVNSWLSAVLTNHVTCLDQLQDYHNNLSSLIEGLILHGKSLLAVHKKVSSEPSSCMESFLESSLPSWVRRSDRKLLEVSGSEVKADVVVVKDGSGDYKTVGEAVAGAPDKGKKRYVIYVKEGVYEENVEVGKKKKNLMIVGDGMNKSVITGSLNVVDGSTTFRSATLAAVGDGFILQDICIQNTAGPEKHQAVALRVGADKSVINRCKIDAYQDTLYTHSLRQFYRDSSISGTVDFIFGNAAVVFQKCDLITRKPMSNQKNMVTAQGRTDPNQNTGTSIQYCNIKASSDLAPVQGQFPTYLGRPWKEYSRTVVMQSTIGDHIDPKGWFEWDGDFALDTLYYAEYKNQGPCSDTSKRVNWTGYHVITDSKEAKQFTVGEFIQGQEWLDSDIVTYAEEL